MNTTTTATVRVTELYVGDVVVFPCGYIARVTGLEAGPDLGEVSVFHDTHHRIIFGVDVHLRRGDREDEFAVLARELGA